MEDKSNWVTIYISKEELIKRKRGNKRNISDDQLHAIERCLQHGIQAPVESFDANAYLGYIDTQTASGGAELINKTTSFVEPNAL